MYKENAKSDSKYQNGHFVGNLSSRASWGSAASPGPGPLALPEWKHAFDLMRAVNEEYLLLFLEILYKWMNQQWRLAGGDGTV